MQWRPWECKYLGLGVYTMLRVNRSSFNKESIFPRLLNDATSLPLTGGGNIGVQRRQLEALFSAAEYTP